MIHVRRKNKGCRGSYFGIWVLFQNTNLWNFAKKIPSFWHHLLQNTPQIVGFFFFPCYLIGTQTSSARALALRQRKQLPCLQFFDISFARKRNLASAEIKSVFNNPTVRRDCMLQCCYHSTPFNFVRPNYW